MYLKSIELFGFKSFAKKSELSFTSPISAIVGPNGSGKSNIAEAFRFVLGEQSIKSLRGKRGEDLIFNGTSDTGRLNRASVRVVFDNTLRFLPLDFDEVTIERIVHRDSVNEYLINGSTVRLKDVIELLAAAHIGSSGHHIISQGEADRILNASLKERKVMIEEALGLKLYQYKKEESKRKLEKTEENIEKVESLRREIMPHIRFLKKQVEKVEKTVELKGELIAVAQEYCKREEEYIHATQADVRRQTEPLSLELKRLSVELSLAKKILEKSSHSDVKSKELIVLEEQLHLVRDEKDKLFRSLGSLDGEIESLSRMVRRQKEAAAHDEHKTVLLSLVEKLSQDIEEKIKAAQHSNSIEEARRHLEEARMLYTDFISHHREKIDHSLLLDVERDIAELTVRKQEAEEKIRIIKEEEALHSRKYSELLESINKEKDSNRDAEKAMFKILAEEERVRAELSLLSSREETLRLHAADFKSLLTELGHLLGTTVLHYAELAFPPEAREKQDERRKQIERLKVRIEENGGLSGTDVMKEYTEASERDTFLAKELTDLEQSAASLKDLIKDLDMRLATEFSTGLEKINSQFSEYFSLMFGGGNAKLSIIAAPKRKKKDADDIFDSEEAEFTEEEPAEEGIDIDVSLPKKKVKGLLQLSGGERALTSIALLFAISQVNPPPFIILDETDAALDEANSKKYGDMIENLSKYSQLIVITHNRETMSRAGILYGVTMGLGGGSRLLSVAFDEAVRVAK